ncbi:hypothetical protein SY83_05575 [Paenibacillus swuensis]|uniref:Heteromeric transposase endonuclease subunit TnsA n=1 Tax=Paenibacillus swuensis TaxID=1178515 RepID=A0A172TFX9_9BACL|nr:heteromeric transposase endonuclease subunit TnsA [Paenibacillus swuensis]ANE45862.1 hypothetical protein SY83_05575 [Paenibacillus swuensis]
MRASLDKRIARWVKEGRGKGTGEGYKPWLTAKSVPSRGKTHRPKGIKTAREHLFLSDWEYFYFLLVDWSRLVVDIREQFPLLDELGLDITETVSIAEELGVEHPIDPPGNELKVMTTDFLIDLHKQQLAVSFKKSDSITTREVEKMEIERMYWARRGLKWELVTEKDIPLVYVKNIEYVHSTYYFDDYHISPAIVEKAKRIMEPLFLKGEKKLTDITNFCDDRLGLQPGESLTIARYCIVSKQWKINMEELIETNQPLALLGISVPNEKGGVSQVAN